MRRTACAAESSSAAPAGVVPNVWYCSGMIAYPLHGAMNNFHRNITCNRNFPDSLRQDKMNGTGHGFFIGLQESNDFARSHGYGRQGAVQADSRLNHFVGLRRAEANFPCYI